MIVFMIVFLAALIIQKTYIYAQDENTVNYDSLTDEADYSEIDSTLDDYGWKGASFKELVRSVASSDTDIGFNFTETVTEAIISNRTVLIQILLLSICAMFLTVLDKNASDSAMLFISFILMTLIVAVFINAARTGYECVQMSVDIYKALCPVFFPAVAYSCGASSAAAYYEIILFLMYIVNVLVKNVLMRCNYVYMILGMFDTFSEKDKFNKMCQLITKIIKLSVKGMLMFFLGLNGIKSLILPLSDSLYKINRDSWGGLFDKIFNIPSDVLITFAFFGLGGLLFYVFIYGAMGALVSKTEDINKSAGSVQFVIMIVYFIGLSQLNNVDGILMKVLSFLPISSYSAMFARVALGNVSFAEIAVSFVILIVSTIAVGILGSKIYRMGTLRYGNPITLRNAFKNLKHE